MNREKYLFLQSAVKAITIADYPFESRVHRLRSFPSECYVKREDELGFGISGSKLRKFRSLIPSLLKEGIQTALVIGGAYSNNVLGISQLLIENSIVPALFLRGRNKGKCQGNFLLLRLLVGEQNIHWVDPSDWPVVESIVQEYAKRLKDKGVSAAVIPEGSSLAAALPGAVTLALDIVRNENHVGEIFNTLCMDAGTGMTAAVTCLAMAFMEKDVKIIVIQLADQKGHFEKVLKEFYYHFQNWLQCEMVLPTNYEVIYPSTAKSFGSINAQVFHAIKKLACEEGFFTDPIYTAKLFMEARHIFQERDGVGNGLIVHSGGALTLAGYQRELERAVIG